MSQTRELIEPGKPRRMAGWYACCTLSRSGVEYVAAVSRTRSAADKYGSVSYGEGQYRVVEVEVAVTLTDAQPTNATRSNNDAVPF